MTTLIVLLAVTALVLVVVARTVRIVPQARAGLVERFGRLPQIAQGDSNKIWLIPTELVHAVERFQAELPSVDANGSGSAPRVNDRPLR